MKRRKFFGLSVLAGLGLTARPSSAKETSSVDSSDSDTIDPYFLDRGDVSPDEQRNVEEFIDYQERVMDGRPAILPRGGRPKRAPNYRFLFWKGELGDPSGRLVGPLSLTPELDAHGPIKFNAQILGFHTSGRDWSGDKGSGTLTIEFRARHRGESMTWLYMQQFDVRKGGGNSVGLEYVAQRDGLPEPVVCEEPNLDVRIQLMRHRKSPGVLRKILKVGSFLTGAPLGGGGGGGGIGGGAPGGFGSSPPLVRVPQMLHEGVALAQATVGGMSDEAPIWRSGFNSFALARGGSRLALRPGFWVALDESEDFDFSDVHLDDVGGRIGLRKKGKPVDVNYLVLALEIEGAAGMRGTQQNDVMPKG